MKKKIVSRVLVMLLLFSLLSSFDSAAMTAAADNSAPAEVNDKATLFAGGTGTAEDPWQISTAEQLYRIHDDLTAHYILIADIYLSSYEN